MRSTGNLHKAECRQKWPGKTGTKRTRKSQKPSGNHGEPFSFLTTFHAENKIATTHNDPENQATDPHLDDERSESTFDPNYRRLRIENAGDVLSAECGRSDAIAVGPPFVVEGSEKIFRTG